VGGWVGGCVYKLGEGTNQIPNRVCVCVGGGGRVQGHGNCGCLGRNVTKHGGIKHMCVVVVVVVVLVSLELHVCLLHGYLDGFE